MEQTYVGDTLNHMNVNNIILLIKKKKKIGLYIQKSLCILTRYQSHIFGSPTSSPGYMMFACRCYLFKRERLCK